MNKQKRTKRISDTWSPQSAASYVPDKKLMGAASNQQRMREKNFKQNLMVPDYYQGVSKNLQRMRENFMQKLIIVTASTSVLFLNICLVPSSTALSFFSAIAAARKSKSNFH